MTFPFLNNKNKGHYSILTLSILCLTLIMSCKKSLIRPTELCTNDVIIIENEHPKASAIQTLIDKYIAKGIPGFTVLISDDDGLWMNSGGYADIENNIKMQPCHINKLGSVTKMMMGTLVWQLEQDGILDIDDPIKLHIPEVADRIENGNDITLGMLINHTSGVYDIAGDLAYNLAVVNDFSRSWTSEEILEYLEGKAATSLPGTEVRYSNSNTMLIGMVVDAAAGKPHGELLKERILTPLGMENTVYYDYSESFPYNYLAQGYLDFNNDGGDIQNISNLNPGSGNGYTGVYSTVTDLYRFMKALLHDKNLTTSDNLDRIFDSMRLGNSGGWKSSIGGIHDEQRELFEEDLHVYGHAGGDIGYSANLNYFPHNKTIFAATYNYGSNLPSPLRNVLQDLREELFLIMAE